jgi:hypothetical protein
MAKLAFLLRDCFSMPAKHNLHIGTELPPSGPTDIPAKALLSARWDDYLEHCPLGQFQQSSRWACIKALDGWKAHHVFLNPQQPEQGGLQLLWKASRFGRIGYVSKGPVLLTEDRATVDAIMLHLKTVVRTLGLRALILQPPDQSRICVEDLLRHSFNANTVNSVIRATAIIDISSERSAWEARMHSKTRQQARTAVKRGVEVRLGDRSDLPLFFALMCESCRRQNTQPNPSRVELLEALWDMFSPHVVVGFAMADGEAVAGLLMIGHGRRLTFWKKGWNSKGAQLYANCLLMVEALGWAQARGYTLVDFVSLAPDIAEILVSGGLLSEQQQRSRDVFNLRLGAEARLLPPARLLVTNPVLRQLYQLFSYCRPLENWLMHRMIAG